ncbi:MAG: hypothetical protein WCD66_09735 [Rhodanobacteraceae bacterium]
MTQSMPLLLRSGVIALLLGAVCALGACRKPSENLGNLTFHKQFGKSHLVGLDAPGQPQLGIESAQGDAGTDVFGLPEGKRPLGMHTQVMQFRFRSRGFFEHEPGAHIDIGLAGTWRKDDPNTPENEARLLGRGIVIGNVSLAAQGCPASQMIEIESYYDDGNRLFAGSCSPSLQENTWYRLTLLAGTNGRTAYRLRDEQGRLLAQSVVRDDRPQLSADLSGWWIGHVFSNRHPLDEWAIDFAHLRVYWRADQASAALLKSLD